MLGKKLKNYSDAFDHELFGSHGIKDHLFYCFGGEGLNKNTIYIPTGHMNLVFL